MIDYTLWTPDELRQGAEMCEAAIIEVLSRSPRARTIKERTRWKIAERERSRITAEIERRCARRSIKLQRDAMWA